MIKCSFVYPTEKLQEYPISNKAVVPAVAISSQFVRGCRGELLWLSLGRRISWLRIERKIVRSLVSARNTFRIVPANYVSMCYTWQCDLNSSKGFAAEKSDKSFLSVPFDDFEPCNSYNFTSTIHSSLPPFNSPHLEPPCWQK